MGTDFKFIHCADLHLDTPFKNIFNYSEERGKRMVASAYKALDRIVEKAIKEKVDFIIFSGDVFDNDFSTPRSRYLFADAIRRSGVRCYVAYGNHDYERKWESSIPLPENAVVFPDRVINVPYPNKENKLTDVIGVSHSRKNEERDLTLDIDGTSCFSIAVVHCDVDAVSEGKCYAPCKLQSLIGKKIDYWALGHVHKRNVLHRSPYVVYPGNTQGRSPKETGEKGAYLVTVSNGVVADMEFFPTGYIEWVDTEADITGKELDQVLETIVSQSKPNAFLNVNVRGSGDLDKMIRLEKESFIDMIEKRTRCEVAKLNITSIPNMNLEERKEGCDFTASVILSSEIFQKMDREKIIGEVCNTKASSSVRYIFENMSDQELMDMVENARSTLLERLEAIR